MYIPHVPYCTLFPILPYTISPSRLYHHILSIPLIHQHFPSIYIITIRIFNEVLTENSVTRVTVRHHEARLMMPSSYPSDGIFSLHRRTIVDSFSCILHSTIVFRLDYVLFYQFYAKITTFFDQKSSVRLLSYTLT